MYGAEKRREAKKRRSEEETQLRLSVYKQPRDNREIFESPRGTRLLLVQMRLTGLKLPPRSNERKVNRR